jgi:glycosyltransferase involved in cell wall biosynthesis
MSARSAARNLAKGAVVRWPGVLPWFEYRLELRKAPRTLGIRRREDAEVARARSGLERGPGIPRARVVTVIPTYRRPERVGAAIRGALDQTVTDHHVVVVDDGGGLPAIEPDPRLTVIELTRNIGVVGAVRNVGIRSSDSEVVAFLDDDNHWTPDHLEQALAILDMGVDLTYSGLERVDDTGRPIDSQAEPFDRRLLRTRGYVDASAIVVRRSKGAVFSRVPRGYRDFPREDWELVWRVSRRHRVALVPATTVRYVVHGESHYTDWTDRMPDVVAGD